MMTSRRPLFRRAAGLMIAGLLAIAAPAVTTLPAAAQQAPEPKAAADYIQGLGDRAIAVIADKTKSQAQREQVFSDLLNQNFDLYTIGRFVVGRYWNAASPAQQQEYLKLFSQMIVAVYTERFSQYAGETFKVQGGQPAGDRDTVVASQVLRTAGPPVNVAWRLRAKDNGLKIVDVVVENVSMSQTQRSEFASVIDSNGGRFEALLEALRQRVQTAQR